MRLTFPFVLASLPAGSVLADPATELDRLRAAMRTILFGNDVGPQLK